MKRLWTKILTLCMTAVLVFGSSVPASAYSVRTTERTFSANGIVTGATIKETNAGTGETVQVGTQNYDASGRVIGGTDKTGHSFSLTYDAYGNQLTYSGWNSGTGRYQTTYTAQVIENGVVKGTLDFTLDGDQTGTMPMSYADFAAEFTRLQNAVRSDASVDINSFFGGKLTNIRGTAGAITRFFGSVANFAKIMQAGWDRANQAAKQAAIDAAEEAGGEQVAEWEQYNEDPAKFAKAVWDEIGSDMDATVSISFGTGGALTSVTVDHPYGNSVDILPGKTTCKQTVGSTDPIVTGKLIGIDNTTNPGHVYLKVQASAVNMLNGAGFQTVGGDGEEIWVEVFATDGKTAEEVAAGIMSDVETQGGRITIAGDVVSDVDGHLTMKVNDGGYTAGKTDAEAQSPWEQGGSKNGFVQQQTLKMANTWNTISNNYAKEHGGSALNRNDWELGWQLLRNTI